MPVTRTRLSTVVLALVACMVFHAAASAGTTPNGSAFTFQGRLTQSGNPVDGATDLIFTLFETAAGATQVGTPQAINALDVVDGAFTVELDFGAAAFGVNERWIEMQVRHPAGSGPFTTLSPRQRVTPAPVSQFAMNADGAVIMGINAGNITSGTMSIARMPTGGSWALGSTLNLDSNLFVVDPVSNRVGIGAVPTVQAFEVFGSSGAAATSGNGGNGIFRIRPSATSAILDIGGTGSPSAHAWLQSRDSANYATNFNLALNPNGGNVGIGTATPNVQLEVAGLGRFTGSGGFSIGSDGNRNRIQATGAGNQKFSMLDTTNSYTGLRLKELSVGATFGDLNAPTNGMIVEGNVGIGTASPVTSYRLTLRGDGVSSAEGGIAMYQGGNAGVFLGYPSVSDTTNFELWSNNNGYLRFGTNGAERLRITNLGAVGINTSAPAAALHATDMGGVAIRGTTTSVIGFAGYFEGPSGSQNYFQRSVGIGTTTPTGMLDVEGTGSSLGGEAGFSEVVASFSTTTASTHTAISIDALAGTDPVLYFAENGNAVWSVRQDTSDGLPSLEFRNQQDSAGDLAMQLRYDTGTGDARLRVFGNTVTDVLEITGADLAEEFPFSEDVQPGMVVAIDAVNPGKMCLSRGAYNKRVAGIVAGANDFSTGLVLGRESGAENGAPVALSGRVYVWCDATGAAIEPGDMLTTAAQPGYAMAVGDYDRAHGAIIGKAMTALGRGETGLVLVLVNLQ